MFGAVTLLFALTQRVEATSFSNINAILIPGSGTQGVADPYPSIINVSGLAGVITDVNVTIYGVSHTSPDNMDVLLVSPGGQKILLMSDAGGTHNVSDLTMTFDDEALSFPSNGNVLFSGSYKPVNYTGNGGPIDVFPAPAPAEPYGSLLSIFDATSPNGDWRLFVFDDQGISNDSGIGSIARGWSLDIATAVTGGSTPVAEPSTLLLLGAGLLGLAARKRRVRS